MFYSHDILTSTRHGVATIWLAATVGTGAAGGKGTLRRLTRKAVLGVDIPKACETIIDPGAPLALRLQSSLLYGVSCVFAQQYRYVLSDAEKTQSDMMTFFRNNEPDPQAGKTKRHLITLEDDPNFDLFSALPRLDLLHWDKELAAIPSQGSTNKFSHMTPLAGLSQGSLSDSRNQPFPLLDLPSSSLCAASYRLPSEFGHQTSPLAKHNPEGDNMPEFRPFADDELDPIQGIGLDFDGDGNLVGIIEPEPEPELPPLPGTGVDDAPHSQGILGAALEAGEQPFMDAGDEQVFAVAEAALPDAEAFPVHGAVQPAAQPNTQTSETTETGQASARNRRGRRRKADMMLDQTDRISRDEFRAWSNNYIQNMEASRKRLKSTTQTQAKKNALALLYGNRIAGVGMANGSLAVPHPLADEFAGRGLKARLHGLPPDDVEFGVKETRGRRRKSPEAFGEQDEQRNVRQRVDDEAELARGEDEDGDQLAVLGDDSVPEMGMDAAPPMDDRHSSSMMPWSLPASAARGQGSTHKAAAVSPSPLHGRGSVVGSVERHSDPVETPRGAVGFDAHDSSLDDLGGALLGALDLPRDSGTPAAPGTGLDVASHEFLRYAAEQARTRGVARDAADDDAGRRWIDFGDLASPAVHSKAVAAEAFLHVLSLASKSAIAVEQDGAARNEPFGPIRIRVDVAASRHPESDDELS